MVTAEHPVAAAIRADITAREALAELAADGMLIAAGQAALPGTPALTLTYHLPSSSAGVRIGVHRPAVLSDVVRLPHRLRQQGLCGASSPTSSSPTSALSVLIPGQNAASGRQSSPTAAACSSPQPASSAPPSRARGTRRASACARQHPPWTSSSTATAQRSSRAQSPTPCATACPATEGGRRTRSASSPASCATSATTASTVRRGHRDLLRGRQVRAALPRSTPPPQAPGSDHRGCDRADLNTRHGQQLAPAADHLEQWRRADGLSDPRFIISDPRFII